jgi:26S proteasome regulatory subunit N5
MVQIGLNEEAYLDVCKHFLAIFKTPSIQQDEEKQMEVNKCVIPVKTFYYFQILKCMVFYLLLSPHDNEKWELLHRTNGMRELEKLPEHKALLELFVHQELIFWRETIEGQYANILFNAQPIKAVLNEPLLPSTIVINRNILNTLKMVNLIH